MDARVRRIAAVRHHHCVKMDHLKFNSTKVVQLTLDENGQLVDDCIKNVAIRKMAKKLFQDKDDEQRLSHALKCKDQGSIRK